MILIKNCRLLPMTSKNDLIKNAYLIIDGSKIIETGTGELPGEDRFAEIIDAHNMVAMPGLVNTHTHTAMTLFRGYADDLPLMEWLQNKIWPLEKGLQSNDYYWGTMLGIAEMIKSGTTCFADMYFQMEQAAKAVSESGIRACLAYGMIGVGPDSEKAFNDSRHFYEEWHGQADGRINVFLGPHAPYTCPPDYLKRVISLSEELDARIHIHLAETISEVEQIKDQYGKTPVVLMKETGLFERPVIAAHCVQLTNAEIDILSQYNVGVAHNPESNMKLASGIARVPDMVRAGVTVAIGTDGAASNNNLDMFQELRSCSLIHKVNTMDPEAIPAYQALEMATVNGARVLGLSDVGTLAPGMKADLILVNFNKPHLSPQHDVAAHLVYSASGSDVDTVLVDGKILMQGRVLTTINEKQVLAEACSCARRMLGSG